MVNEDETINFLSLVMANRINRKRKYIAHTGALICFAFDKCCLKTPFSILLQSFYKILSEKVARRCTIMSYNTIIMLWISVKFLRTQMSIYQEFAQNK